MLIQIDDASTQASKTIDISNEDYQSNLTELEDNLVTLVMLFNKAVTVGSFTAYLLQKHPMEEAPPIGTDLHDEVCPFCSCEHSDWSYCADIFEIHNGE